MTVIEQETIQVNRQLAYVFGEIQIPGRGNSGQVLYYGWGKDGRPLVTTDRLTLTGNGMDMADSDTPKMLAFETPVSNYTFKALEFEEMSLPTDNPDRGRAYTEDVVSIACTDDIGAIKFLEVKELTLLKAIIDCQVEWNLGSASSYSIAIPDDETETLNILLFSPSGEASNELNYRTFLLKVIKTLTTVDRKQNPPDQKGYMDVLREAARQLEAKSNQNQPKGVFQKIATDLGILNEAGTNGFQELQYCSIDQLLFIIQQSYKTVSESFEAGK